MRRLIVLLGLVGLLAGGTAPTASALPSDARISIDPHAQFVTPTEILVAVTYVCPASFVSGGVSVNVSQESTGGSGNGFLAPVPCTDEPERLVVPVTGGPFTLGPALAQASIFGTPTFFFGDFDRRRIQIVF
jgi:hypothetical protein